MGVGARIAIERLGRGGDTTKRVLGGGVVNRFETRPEPAVSELVVCQLPTDGLWTPQVRDAAQADRNLPRHVVRLLKVAARPVSSRASAAARHTSVSGARDSFSTGRLAKTVLRRAKLTETAVRLSVLGLVADAERFAVPADGAGAGKKL